MVWTVNDLKVDQTVLTSDDVYIFITNINIPVGYFAELESVLARAYNFLQGEYDTCPVLQYQVTATYELRNTVDNSIRQWSGSFNPRQNNVYSSLADFEYFDATFIQKVAATTDTKFIQSKLHVKNITTNYVFERLTSIIINAQAAVSKHFPTLVRRNLIYNRHDGKHYRNHITLDLP